MPQVTGGGPPEVALITGNNPFNGPNLSIGARFEIEITHIASPHVVTKARFRLVHVEQVEAGKFQMGSGIGIAGGINVELVLPFGRPGRS